MDLYLSIMSFDSLIYRSRALESRTCHFESSLVHKNLNSEVSNKCGVLIMCRWEIFPKSIERGGSNK